MPTSLIRFRPARRSPLTLPSPVWPIRFTTFLVFGLLTALIAWLGQGCAGEEQGWDMSDQSAVGQPVRIDPDWGNEDARWEFKRSDEPFCYTNRNGLYVCLRDMAGVQDSIFYTEDLPTSPPESQ